MGPNKDQVIRNGYKINGWEFHTKEYGSGKSTINTGVYVQGDAVDALRSAFYGEVEEIIELSYKGTLGGCINLFKCRWFDSEKGMRVDRHGIVDIDLHMSTYEHAPFVLPTQVSQVYYTPSPGRKRDRTPADWQVVIHIPARNRIQLLDNEVYQEEIEQRPINPLEADNDLYLIEAGIEADEVEPDSLHVPDLVQLDVDDETKHEDKSEEEDGYDSPIHVGNESDSDNGEQGCVFCFFTFYNDIYLLI